MYRHCRTSSMPKIGRARRATLPRLGEKLAYQKFSMDQALSGYYLPKLCQFDAHVSTVGQEPAVRTCYRHKTGM
jgi:hypothetical protein